MSASNVYFHSGVCKPGSVLVTPLGWLVAECVQNSKTCCGLTLPYACATPMCIASLGRLAKPLQAFKEKFPKRISPAMLSVVEIFETLTASCGEDIPDIDLSVMALSDVPPPGQLAVKATASKAGFPGSPLGAAKVQAAQIAKEQSTDNPGVTMTTSVGAEPVLPSSPSSTPLKWPQTEGEDSQDGIRTGLPNTSVLLYPQGLLRSFQVRGRR